MTDNKQLLDAKLFKACEEGNGDAVQSLLQQGANINARDHVQSMLTTCLQEQAHY
jgi:hypothetical protein